LRGSSKEHGQCFDPGLANLPQPLRLFRISIERHTYMFNQRKWFIFGATIIIIGVIIWGTSISIGIFLPIFLLGIAAIIVLLIIFAHPYLGIAFMIASLPLGIYTQIPGFENFSSITAIFGLLTLVFYVFKNPRHFLRVNIKDTFLYIGVIFLIISFSAGIVLPISYGINYPLTYIQLLILIWLTGCLFDSRQKIETFMKFFIAGNFLGIILSLRTYSVVNIGGDINRLAGTVGNANEFGIYLSIAVIMCVYMSITTSRLLIRILYFTLIIPFIATIILSGSRGAILFLVMVIAIQLLRLLKRKAFLLIVIIGAFIGAYLIARSYLPTGFTQRIESIPNDILNSSDTIGLRYKLWQFGLTLWWEKPILGIGPGMFQYYEGFSGIYGQRALVAHNMYVTLLVENGIIGLFIFIFILFKSLFNYERTIRFSVNQEFVKELAITWEAIMLVLLLNGLKGEFEPNKVLWLCIGLSMVVGTLVKEYKQKDELSQKMIVNNGIKGII
jgi:O-antigen ligase